jgi:hypothetical protein
MTIVKVLVDHVDNWMAGDIVEDAPAGIVNMAAQKAKHAVTGELLAEIITDVTEPIVQEAVAILAELTGKAIEYGIPDAETLSITELISAIVHTEWVNRDKAAAQDAAMLKDKADREASDGVLSELKKKAKELKIDGYTKMSIEELNIAIAAVVGGEADAK